MLQSMAEVARMARERGEICYLYKTQAGYIASFQYWKDWLFKAYPGGRKVVSIEGRKHLTTQAAMELA